MSPTKARAKFERKIVDLFCGCGGFSLGAARAGFNVVGAIDNDARTLSSHAKNFPQTTHLKCDLSETDGGSLLNRLGVDSGDLDGIIGGPPCQGFSHIGRRNASDSRNSLLKHYFRLVSETAPSFFVCENVVGLLDPRHDGRRREALDWVRKEYELLPVMTLSAHHYGAPTTRTRVFILGFRKSKRIAIDAKSFAPPEDVQLIRVKDALRGLPDGIRADSGQPSLGWLKIDASTNGTFGAKLAGEIPQGVGDSRAISLLSEKRLVSGCVGTRHDPKVVRRFRKVPPGGVDKISRFPRLDPEDFCPTLRAGTGKDFGSHQAARPIHPVDHRVITPREAARLQGFPDWFQFDETKWHSFRQIGNSVSPILAEHVLATIHDALDCRNRTKKGKR